MKLVAIDLGGRGKPSNVKCGSHVRLARDPKKTLIVHRIDRERRIIGAASPDDLEAAVSAGGWHACLPAEAFVAEDWSE